MLNFPIYLDHNATTPCDHRVLESMLPYFTGKFGNAASRTHFFGWEAAEAVAIAREQVAALIGAEPAEIVFTSGSTEGDNLAIKGVFDRYASKGNHIITAATEHNAVLDTCRHIERMGGEVDYLPVGSDGRIRLQDLEQAIKPSTILISIMLANNEIGVLQPVQEISRIARQREVIFFTDATQAVGKIPIDVREDGIDVMAFSAHKLYGPKGVGALYVRRKNPRVSLTAQMDGGGHERGMRSGTLNVPGIVGFGKACEYCRQEMVAEAVRIADLRDRLEEGLIRQGEAAVNGSREHRLPNTTNISFKGVEAGSLLAGVNKELALSSGSACTSASQEPSHVLKALGLSDEASHSSLRFSLGRTTTKEEIDYAIALIVKTVARLREENLLTRRR